MTKNKKALKTGNQTTNARKKPVKLSLADFHNNLDQKLNPKKNSEQMDSANWECFHKNGVFVGGTRGRGVCCDKLPIIAKNVGDPTEQNVTNKSAKNVAEPKKIRGNLDDQKIPKQNGNANGRLINQRNQRETGKPNEARISVSRTPNPYNASHSRPKTLVRSTPRIPTPPRYVPQELKEVDRMTSADFRHDYGAHLDNMRTRQKGQQHMLFFQSAIHQNRHLFKGHTILVLCCGTATLALMAAKMGAKRVYAVDYSKVTCYAELVVRENRYESIIKVFHGRMKDLKLPGKVDGIICNWMGHCLLYESEIVEVLEARDRWLKKGGFILPDLGSLYLVASEEHMLKNDRCNWWRSVYGFNMNAMRRYALAEPRYAKTTGEKLLTLAHRILSIDLKKAKIEDLFIDRNIRLKVNREGYLECFLLFFDVEFSSSHIPIKMSCNPCIRLPYKSLWLQTVLFVEQPFIMRSNLHYTGNLKFKPLKPNNFKEMEIRIEFYEGLEYDDLCTRRVAKRWLMLEHFQTFSEVESCQDEQGENGGHDF